MLVGDRFDGPSGKQLHTVLAVGDDVVARGGGRIQVLAPLLDPVKGVVHGTEFSGIALVALRAPGQLGPEGDMGTGPHFARVSAPPGKVM